MPKVTTIPPTRAKYTSQPIQQKAKKKVAAYARVSTELEEQQNSYEAQKDYFTNFIKKNPEWKFAGMYADEGISATNTKNRDSFNQMIKDALAGKIDLIVTKSVSRFARNTVDSLTTIRELKDKGIDVYFEKENIHTLDAKGELLLTIMSSLAQEESRSISENTIWGTRKKMQDGKFSLAYSMFLGYDKGPDGKLVINEEQAKTVRLIYKRYLDGLSLTEIADELHEMGIRTVTGREKWDPQSISRILTNEKYMGDALLQKTYVSDFLTKKVKKNNGEVPQYYVENAHEPIVSKEIFYMAQQELDKRKGRGSSGRSFYAFRIKCGECGAWYGSKIWHSNSKNRSIVYQCNDKYKTKGKVNCRTPHLRENEIKDLFVSALNKITDDKDEVINNLETVIALKTDTTSLEQEKASLLEEMNRLARLANTEILTNSRKIIPQQEYDKKYNQYVQDYEEKGRLTL